MNAREVRRLDGDLMGAYRRLDDLRWYDPARPHVFLHIRKHLDALTDAYAALEQVPLEKSFGEWVKWRADAIPKFAKHFDPVPGPWRLIRRSVSAAAGAWTVATLVLPVFGIVVGTATLGAAAIALLNTVVEVCFCKLFTLTWMGALVGIFAVFVGGFDRKRTLLLGDANQDGEDAGASLLNVYEAEQRLLRELDEPRRGEFQFDVLGWFLMGITILGTYWSSVVLDEHGVANWAGWFREFCFGAAGVCFVIGLFVLRSSTHRPWSWKHAL